MTMKMTPVESSNIAAIGHDGATTLRVQFKNGTAYDYAGVSPALFVTLLNAESVGKALNEHIKRGGFAYTKLESV